MRRAERIRAEGQNGGRDKSKEVESMQRFRRYHVLPFCRSAVLPFRPSAIPPFRRSAVPPFCRSAGPPFRRSALLSRQAIHHIQPLVFRLDYFHQWNRMGTELSANLGDRLQHAATKIKNLQLLLVEGYAQSFPAK